jgi:hypothetical protein
MRKVARSASRSTGGAHCWWPTTLAKSSGVWRLQSRLAGSEYRRGLSRACLLGRESLQVSQAENPEWRNPTSDLVAAAKKIRVRVELPTPPECALTESFRFGPTFAAPTDFCYERSLFELMNVCVQPGAPVSNNSEANIKPRIPRTPFLCVCYLCLSRTAAFMSRIALSGSRVSAK